MFDDIEQTVDSKFWSIINDLRIYGTKKQRSTFLQGLKSQLVSKAYFPGIPLTVKEKNKGHGVVRQVPIFNLSDYSVYYYCVRKLELVLAKNRVPGTYGGWSMGGRIRNMENEDGPEEDYQLTYSFNPAAWARYYGDFNAKLYGKIQELREAGQGNYLVFELDIANYYDNIQLAILENKIRADGDYSESGVLDLLMYFLSYSNRIVTQYQKRSVGIPMDAFGDCSRLLANYYLQDHDQYMADLAVSHNATYFRYADDQILFVPDAETGHDMIRMASRKLASIGLNINQKKVVKRTLDELYIYRSFEINDLFKERDSNKDTTIVNEFARRTYEAIDAHPTALKDRGYPLVKRLVTADYNVLSPDYRTKLMSYIFDEDFIYAGRANNYWAAYDKMRPEEKTDYITLLNRLSVISKHSDFHYEVLAFYRRNRIDPAPVMARIIELHKELYGIE